METKEKKRLASALETGIKPISSRWEQEKNSVDEVVEEAELINRAKQLVSLWIDNPGRAFTPIKNLYRRPLGERMLKGIAELDWEESLSCFFKEDVRATLEFVQASMAK